MANDLEIQSNTTFPNYFHSQGKTLTVNFPYTVQLNNLNDAVNFTGSGTVKITGYTNDTVTGDIEDFQILGSGYIIDNITIPEINFMGTGTRTIYNNLTLTGNVNIGSGSILQNMPGNTRTFTIDGNIINNGTIKNNSKGSLYVKTKSNIENNGTWTPYRIYLIWNSVTNATEYQFQITDTSGTWQTEEILTNTQKQVANSVINETHLWRTRAKVDGVYGNWSDEHEIN